MIFLQKTCNEEGYWYQKLGIAGSDVKDCFIVPVFSISDFRSQANSKTIITIDVSISGTTTTADDIIAFRDWLLQGNYGYDTTKTVVENLEDYYINLYFYNKRDGKYYKLEYTATVPFYNYAFVEITDPAEGYNFVRKANNGYLDSHDDLILYDYLQSKFTDEGSNFWNSTKQIYESFTKHNLLRNLFQLLVQNQQEGKKIQYQHHYPLQQDQFQLPLCP